MRPVAADLTAMESRLIERLRKGEGRLVTYAEIAVVLWDDADDAAYRASLHIHVHRLRRKGFEIRTVTDMGLRLVTDACCPTCGKPRGD